MPGMWKTVTFYTSAQADVLSSIFTKKKHKKIQSGRNVETEGRASSVLGVNTQMYMDFIWLSLFV